MKSLRLEEIAKAVDGCFVSSVKDAGQIVIDRITTDTRKIEKGDFFIPIKGEKFDGHEFISQAFEKGAVCCFSEKKLTETKNPYILVEDTRKAIRDLAEYYRSLFSIPVIAITGSVGKTTTKDMISSVLMQKYRVLKTEGNFNNEIGLPLTLFRLEESHEVVVLEMGMNQFGEIHNLSKVARPSIGVITNIGVSHIENLGSKEGILQAKRELFDFMTENSIAVLNGNDEYLMTLENDLKQKIIWYGTEKEHHVFSENITPRGLEGISALINTEKGSFSVLIPVPGGHMVLNAMAATAVGLQLGLSLEEIKTGIEAFVPTKMRMAIIKTGKGTTIIDDAYNANPVSMKASLDVLVGSKGKTAAILGDMFELGTFSEKMHYEVGKYAAELKIDTIICIGEASQAMCHGALDCGHRNVFYYPSQDLFLEEGVANLEAGITILVKASRGMHFEKTVEKLNEVNL